MITFLGLITLRPGSRLGGEVGEAGERLNFLNNAQRIETFPTVEKKGNNWAYISGRRSCLSKSISYMTASDEIDRVIWNGGYIEASLCHGSVRSVRPCSQSSGRLFHGSGSPATQGLKLMQRFVISCLLWAINLLDQLLQIFPEFQMESTDREPTC